MMQRQRPKKSQKGCSVVLSMLLPTFFIVTFQYFTFSVTMKSSDLFSSLEGQQQQPRESDERCANPNIRWRIVLTGNLGYENDFLNWYYHCIKAGLCPATPEQRRQPHQLGPRRQAAGTKEDGNGEYNGDTSNACPPLRHAEVVLYAEDVPLYEKYHTSRLIDVKKAWEVGSKFNNTKITGNGRFTYSDQARFRHMMSRRPSILLLELEDAAGTTTPHDDATWNSADPMYVLFMDLDTIIAKDPRPYFTGEYDFWAADAMNDWSGPYNAGLLAMRPTPASVSCIQRWRTFMEKQVKAKYNQKTFNNIVRRMNDTITHRLLDKTEFPVGRVLLDLDEASLNEGTLGKDLVVLHNNYCGTGCSKPDRARKVGLWKDDPPIDFFLS